MTLADLPQVASLSAEEKLRLVEELWDDIAATPSEVPFPTWQKEELDRRKAAFEADPTSGRTWEEVKAPALQAKP